jgi:hypothetical protein
MEGIAMNKELKELAQFIIDNGWELHIEDECNKNIFIDVNDLGYFIEKLKELFSNFLFDEHNLVCYIKDGYVAILFDDILDLIDKDEFEDEKELIELLSQK